jgi:carbonic anhydrase/acetyltransferase-like protein (isoleucine patch superfamily)
MTIRKFAGHAPSIDNTVFVDPMSLVIGKVTIGKDSSVWPFALIRGDVNTIEIGERCSVQDGTVIHVTHSSSQNPGGFPTKIGNEVTIGHKVMLHGCTIQDRVLVGMGAIIMDGATVESDVVIGGGSLVPPGKTLESGHLYVGSPVRKARKLSEAELAYFHYTAGKYVELKEAHKQSLLEDKA